MSAQAVCTCKVGPGKFEGEDATTFMAWEQTMMGNSDITTYEDERPTDWLRSPLNLDADVDVVKAALSYGYCESCVESAGQDISGGISLYEDGQGFVYGTVYETREEFDAALSEAEAIQREDGEDK